MLSTPLQKFLRFEQNAILFFVQKAKKWLTPKKQRAPQLDLRSLLFIFF